jgi:phosphohistidine phosphatase SixA
MKPLALLFTLLIASPFAIAQETPQPQDKDVVAALQKGGYVIYFRHTQTDPTQADTDTQNLDNTKAQRHLTDKGRAQAKEIGQAFRSLKIPVSSVLTSQYYRAMEVARLAEFGPSKTSLDVTEAQNTPPVESQRRAAALRKLLATVPSEGTNVVIVSHRPNLQDAAGKEFGDMAEGEAVIFQPQGEKGFRAVARVKVDQWAKWASAK